MGHPSPGQLKVRQGSDWVKCRPELPCVSLLSLVVFVASCFFFISWGKIQLLLLDISSFPLKLSRGKESVYDQSNP